MTEKIKVFRPDPNIDTGKVIAPASQDTGRGLLFEDGRNLLRGSEKADMGIGSDYDDVIISGGIESNSNTLESGKGLESIDGNGGFDTLVLPGNREDYHATIPGPGYYPSFAGFGDDKFLYGSRINLEDVHGNTISLTSVERIAFAGDAATGHPKDFMQGLEDSIKSGDIPTITTTDLFRQTEMDLSPEELVDARLASTKEAADYLARQNATFADETRLVEILAEAIEVARAAHPDIMSYDTTTLQQPDIPNSSVTAQSIGYTGELNQMPLPAPGTAR